MTHALFLAMGIPRAQESDVKAVALALLMFMPSWVGAFELVGHRGASAHAPENTLKSILMAYAQGAKVAECDIQLTKDNKLVLMHDDTLERTGGLARRVDEMTYAEISQVEVGCWKGAEWCGVKVPLLPEVIAEIPNAHLLFVEIKSGDYNQGASTGIFDALAQLINATPDDILQKLVFISFDHVFLIRLKNSFAQVKILSLLVDKPYVGSWPKASSLGELEIYIALAKKHNLFGLFLEYGEYLSPSIVNHIKEQGLKVAVWNLPEDDTVEVARKMLELGIDFYNTNDIKQIKTALGL